MKKVIAVLALAMGVSSVVLADGIDTITCKFSGYTNNPDNFFDMQVGNKLTVFQVTATTVTLDGEEFQVIDPDSVGLANIAVVYKNNKNNRLLYLYKNELGEKEVGISNIEDDSDTFFGDKSVYKGCALTEENNNAVTQQVSGIKARGVHAPQQIYSF